MGPDAAPLRLAGEPRLALDFRCASHPGKSEWSARCGAGGGIRVARAPIAHLSAGRRGARQGREARRSPSPPLP